MNLSFLDKTGLGYLWNKVRTLVSSKANKAFIIETTLHADQWQDVTSSAPFANYPYQYTLSDESITSTTLVVVNPYPDNPTELSNASLCNMTDTIDGGILFWAKNMPTVDINVRITCQETT